MAKDKKLSIPFEIELDLLKSNEEDGNWYVEGFCGSTELDLQGDIITEEAFKKSEKDLIENSTVLWNHDVDQVIGKVIETEARKEGLWVKVLISKTVPDLWKKIQEGIINKFSIRGKIIDAIRKFVKEVKKIANVINEMYLIEASLVSIPANPAAKTLRWYIEKSLNDYILKGGEIPEFSEKAEPATGTGQGAGNSRNRTGGRDLCYCSVCKKTVEHQRGTPCIEQKCPDCGASLTPYETNKGDVMTEIFDMLTKMSERLIADEDKAILETLKSKLKEQYPMPYPKKKSGEAYKQEEIDSLETELEKARKIKKAEELTEEEEKSVIALVDEIRKAKKDKYPEAIVLKKKSGEAYKQEEIDNLEIELEKAKKVKKAEELTEEEEKSVIALADEIRKTKKDKYPYSEVETIKNQLDEIGKAKKLDEEKIKSLEVEIKSLKADIEIEKRFSKIQSNFSDAESIKVKSILKKSLLGETLTIDETQSIAKMAPTSLFVGSSVESVIKNMSENEKDRLIKLGGIKIKKNS